uniref:Facilitated trehalose transporter Tret1 n=2 Tax=Cacopsylla melanoneura TaxID=428564 RepID=A0A8D8W9Z3_9HEMI
MFSGTTRQILAASSACIAAFTIGMTFAWSAPVLEELLSKDSPIPMTSDEGSWMVAIIELGNYISPIPAGYLASRIGRKWSLLLTGPITAVSWIIAMYSRSVMGLFVMRSLQGFSMAAICVISPMYLGEIAEVSIRGTVGTLFQISTHLGILYTYVLGSELSYMNYLISSLVVPIVFMITFIFMPESPYYYVSKNQDEKAIESLKWLRNKTADQVEKELGTIKENSSKPTERTNFKQFMGRANMRALMLSFFLILFRQFTGVQSLIAFANTVFASSVSFLSPDHITILFAVILLVSIFPATYFIDKSGRRILMLVSSGGCALSSFVAGIYYYLTIELAYEIPYTSWVPFVSLSLLGVFFNIGFGSLLTPLLSEFFASSVKAADMTVCGITGTTLGLASYKLFYYLNEDVGVYSNFIFGGVLCTISTVYLYVFLFETKGKTFNEIQMMFKYGEDWNDSKQSRDTSSASAVLNSNKENNDAENGGIPLTEIKC